MAPEKMAYFEVQQAGSKVILKWELSKNNCEFHISIQGN